MYKVLHVDDNEGDLILAREAFKQTDLTIELESALNGVEAIEKLTKAEILPDLVLLDINMPVMNGKEFLSKIRTEEKLKNIPVVMLTTSDAPKDISDCYDLNANAYVTKKQDFSSFLDSINKIASFWLDINIYPNKNYIN